MGHAEASQFRVVGPCMGRQHIDFLERYGPNYVGFGSCAPFLYRAHLVKRRDYSYINPGALTFARIEVRFDDMGDRRGHDARI